MHALLAASPLGNINALTIAVVLGWILSVCLHEMAHAWVALLGGDDSVRERGYLVPDPTRFIDPVMTIAIPAVILLMGGLPLPGGAVLIDRSRLRSRQWEVAVSAAGPAANFAIFLAIVIVLHPRLGLADPNALDQPNWVNFLGALGFLEMFSVLFNLIPLPPLDGFGLIEHRLDPETRWKLRQPQTSFACLTVLFFLMWIPQVSYLFFKTVASVIDFLGGDVGVFIDGFNIAFTGSK